MLFPKTYQCLLPSSLQKLGYKLNYIYICATSTQLACNLPISDSISASSTTLWFFEFYWNLKHCKI